jgi:hypothetical protein
MPALHTHKSDLQIAENPSPRSAEKILVCIKRGLREESRGEGAGINSHITRIKPLKPNIYKALSRFTLLENPA